jgi:hypothetical protein
MVPNEDQSQKKKEYFKVHQMIHIYRKDTGRCLGLAHKTIEPTAVGFDHE